MPKIYIDNIDPFFVFKWFYEIVIFDSGDGAAVICCGNIEEAYSFFREWAEQENRLLYPDTKRYQRNGVNFINNCNSNENFMFCDKEIELPFGDTSFIIKEDCKPYFSPNFILKKV